jgi:hypothetical protein
MGRNSQPLASPIAITAQPLKTQRTDDTDFIWERAPFWPNQFGRTHRRTRTRHHKRFYSPATQLASFQIVTYKIFADSGGALGTMQ